MFSNALYRQSESRYLQWKFPLESDGLSKKFRQNLKTILLKQFLNKKYKNGY